MQFHMTGNVTGLSPKCTSKTKVRRGARSRGITSCPSSAPDGQNDASLCPSQRPGPAESHSARTKGNPKNFKGPPTPPSPSISSSKARPTPPATQTNGMATATLEVMWWNIEHASSIWHDETFRSFIDDYDLVFFLETHHSVVPHAERLDHPRPGNIEVGLGRRSTCPYT